jgi:hypothetical protein
VSVTTYVVGNAAGTDGPAMFLPPGKAIKPGFTEKFLEKNGAPSGSCIVMTANGYMTEAAWVEGSPKIAGGMRKIMDAINPNWWGMKVVDGFGPHTTSLEAMQVYHDEKIMLIKEEGDTSQVNQVYDQDKAKEQKMNMRGAVVHLRHATNATKGVLDGWHLVLVALHAVRLSSPEVWVASAKKVNLHPDFRVSFADWCERIASFLQGGQNFKSELAVDKYALLPTWWHGMAPEEKKAAVAIVAEEGSWTPACLRRLYSECHIPLADMQNLRLCCQCAKDDPAQLEKGVPEPAAEVVLEGEAAAAQKKQTPLVAGLASFMLCPKSPGVTGGTPMITDPEARFQHTIRFTRRMAEESVVLVPSSHLAVEMRSDQTSILNPTLQDYSAGAMMKSAGGSGAQTNAPKRKMGALAGIRGHSGLLNDPVRLKRLKEQSDLAQSLSSILRAQQQAKKSKKDADVAGLFDKAPPALLKLAKKDLDASKLTKEEICSIAYRCFATTLNNGLKKAKLVDDFQELVAKHPQVLTTSIAEAKATPALAAGMEDEEQDHDEEEGDSEDEGGGGTGAGGYREDSDDDE